jgi:hypothetical protein
MKVWQQIEPDQPLHMTREQLRDIQEHSERTFGVWESEKLILARLQALTGRRITLVEALPDSEETVLIADVKRYQATDFEARCARCGRRVWHRLRVPSRATIVCLRCVPVARA